MMKIEEIKELVQMMEQSTLTALELHIGEDSLRLERNTQVSTILPEPAQVLPEPAQVSPVQTAVQSVVIEQPSIAATPKGTPVTSPLVGVFYAAPSPTDAPYVTVGSTVKKGDVLCIVEAMKLMNEITAEQDGTIVEICAENGSVVEFGQPLFYLA